MAVEYCHRGGHYIDLDYNCEGRYFGTEWCCYDCMTDAEAEAMEADENHNPGDCKGGDPCNMCREYREYRKAGPEERKRVMKGSHDE